MLPKKKTFAPFSLGFFLFACLSLFRGYCGAIYRKGLISNSIDYFLHRIHGFSRKITIFEIASTSSKRVTLVPIFFGKNQSPAPLFLLFRKKPRLRSPRKNIRSFLARFFPFCLPTTFSRLLRRKFPIRDYFNLIRLIYIAIGFTAVTLLEEIEREFLALSFILFYKKSYLLYLRTCLPAAHDVFMRCCYFLQTVPLR